MGHHSDCGSNMHPYDKGGHYCNCGEKVYHFHQQEDENCYCSAKFLDIAHEAWKEVLKEKIKAKIISRKGEHMDKLADIISTASGEFWKNKIASKSNVSQFKDSLKEYFSTSCD